VAQYGALTIVVEDDDEAEEINTDHNTVHVNDV
jgi:hypothetical protein